MLKTASDHTHFFHTPYPHHERRDETPRPELPQGVRQATIFVSHRGYVPALEVDTHGTFFSHELDQVPGYRDIGSPASGGETEKASENRLRLLDRKYSGVASTEDFARLAMLTVKLRSLSPRVTPDDLDRMDAMIDHAKSVDLQLAEIEAKFGLK